MRGRSFLQARISWFFDGHGTTKRDLSCALEISESTLYRVQSGKVNRDREYSDNPSPRRLIANSDFPLVRDALGILDSMRATGRRDLNT